MHELFLNLLDEYSLKGGLKDRLEYQLNETFEEMNSSKIVETELLRERIEDLKKKIKGLNEKFINDAITKSVYDEYLKSYNLELKNAVNQSKATILAKESSQKSFIKQALAFSENLCSTWKNGDVAVRTQLQNLVFPTGVRYDRRRDTLETSNVNEMLFALNNLKTGGESKIDLLSALEVMKSSKLE